MLTHPTVDKLHELRCPAMARALTEQLASPQVHNLSFEERLLFLAFSRGTPRGFDRTVPVTEFLG